MALSNVNANDVALAADLNQYKEALEGTRDFSPLLKAASSQDFYIRMSNTGGGQFFKVQNSSSVDALVVNSNGVVTPTTLQITGLAAPADATAGRMSYDTTKNVLVYGNGSQVVEIADGASTTVVPLSAPGLSTTNDTLETIADWTVTLAANSIYVMEFVVIFLADGTPDIKFQWDIGSVPNATIQWGQTGASCNQRVHESYGLNLLQPNAHSGANDDPVRARHRSGQQGRASFVCDYTEQLVCWSAESSVGAERHQRRSRHYRGR